MDLMGWIVSYPEEDEDAEYLEVACNICGSYGIVQKFKDNGDWEVFCGSCGYEENVLNAFYDHRFSALLVKMPTWICVGVKPIE